MYRVFIVDDEPFICKGLRETVEWDSLGLEISGEARNGMDAMALIEVTPPNILITDIRMPGMDGISLIKAIRERSLNIHILILSAFSDYTFLKEAIRLGVDGYLLKPIDMDELVSNLSNLVNVIDEETLKSSCIFQGMELMRTNTLNRLVNNEISRNELDDKTAFLDISLDSDHYLCAVCAPPAGTDGGDCWADLGIMAALQEDNGHCADVKTIPFISTKKHLVILYCGRNEAGLIAYAGASLKRIADLAQDSPGFALLFHTGDTVHAREDIHRSYAAAIKKIMSDTQPEIDPLESRWKSVVSRAADYVSEHYHEALSLKQIAYVCDINTSYLGQIFRKATNESFTDYVNRTRIEKAKELLAQTNLKVYEVSRRVGFTDYHYFLKIFKKVTGIVPTDTRSEDFCHKI